MNRISAYIDVDTLFDTRRGILEHLLKKNGYAWTDYQEAYKGRRIDFFESPELGIRHDKYLERFTLRDIDDWCDDTMCYFYPSKITHELLPIIRTIEFGAARTISVAAISLHVNMYPFEMSEQLQVQLINHLRAGFKIPIELEMISVGFDAQTADFIGNYDYVFRYGHLINPEFKAWFDTFPSSARSGTKIIVPELFVKPIGEVDDLEAMRKDSAKTLIEKMSAIQGGKCIFIPLDKSLFDYVE